MRPSASNTRSTISITSTTTTSDALDDGEVNRPVIEHLTAGAWGLFDGLTLGWGSSVAKNTGTIAKETIFKQGTKQAVKQEAKAVTAKTEQSVVANQASKIKIPKKAYDIADDILKNNRAAPKGYKGGKVWANDGRNGSQILPKGLYKEYDINQFVKGQSRGPERIVINFEGEVWFTNDHYKTFTKLK